MFALLILLMAIGTAVLPLIVSEAARFFPRLKLQPGSPWLPIVAAALLLVSIALPDVHISKQTSTFQQHFVGGGMYSACLYLYAKRVFGWRPHWIIDMIFLFAWVSALGVANKLIEFAFLELRLVAIDTSDAYWDLFANTLGGFVGYFLLSAF